MLKTPKSLRLHIGLFGRMNVGKSSFLNLVAGQDVAITSPIPGTTTDVVEKPMELLPVGPVVFLDTAGLDDTSALGARRIQKTKKIFDRADVLVLIVEAGTWSDYEEKIYAIALARKLPLIIVINKVDLNPPDPGFLALVKTKAKYHILSSSIDPKQRDTVTNQLKQYLLAAAPDDFLKPQALIGDLVPAGGMAVLIVPIDKEAPKGRIILPQVQVIRDALDHSAGSLVVKETEYAHFLKALRKKPDLVICDSQVVDKMVAATPAKVPCTTFSILFSRYRGDLAVAARGTAVLQDLKPGDKILIAEACSHHPIEDDIGRVKMPRWLKKYVGGALDITVTSGYDYPEDLKDYKIIIHCGGCMINKRQMLSRIQQAQAQGVLITNYGLCISLVHHVLERVLQPFPDALKEYQQAVKNK
ncbi:MAG: [FeFe] hydrogenase H-cluster maturation GTPase HydF [bacterium]|nr:[FeFe] hydrogenase H-cluster maturation GTPase HydF [bacterium]